MMEDITFKEWCEKNYRDKSYREVPEITDEIARKALILKKMDVSWKGVEEELGVTRSRLRLYIQRNLTKLTDEDLLEVVRA